MRNTFILYFMIFIPMALSGLLHDLGFDYSAMATAIFSLLLVLLPAHLQHIQQSAPALSPMPQFWGLAPNTQPTCSARQGGAALHN